MQDAGVSLTSFTYIAVLKACGGLKDMEYCKQILREVISRGLEADPYIGPAVVGMDAKTGNLAEAYEVFNRCPQGNIFLWNTMIGGLADSGYGKEALELYDRVKQRTMEPSRHTYVHVLRTCSSVGALDEARAIYSDIRRNGLHLDPYVGSALVDMYAEWGQMEDARRAFDALPAQPVGVWNRLIRAYGNNDKPRLVLQCKEGLGGFSPSLALLARDRLPGMRLAGAPR